MEVRPSLIGKLATVLQLAGVAGALLVLIEPELERALPEQEVLALAAVATGIAGVQYVARGLGWYQARPA
jgi:hypothetical protein